MVMYMNNNDSRIIVALDFDNPATALALLDRLDPARAKAKIGKELFTRSGPALVEQVVGRGFDVFLDLKYHDIPNTVAKACLAAADLGVWMVNVHALGGQRMMEAAREAVANSTHQPRLIAVTVLTSMGGDDLHGIGLAGDPLVNVERLARLAQQSGLDGVVCSAQEAAALRGFWRDGCFVTPGIRPAWAAVGDQVRVMTPSQAMANGASYLVIGRPITGADDPMDALARVEQELSA